MKSRCLKQLSHSFILDSKQIKKICNLLSEHIGEPVIETSEGTSATLTQGFQQSRLELVELDEVVPEELDFSIYPNPAKDNINIEIKGYEGDDITIELYDINGKILMNKKINAELTSIDVSIYPAAKYLLKMYNADRSISSTYQVIKTN